MGVLGTTFPSTPFLSIDAVGSEIWTALHEYINCGTHQRVHNHSSVSLVLNVRLLGFVVGCFVNDHRPPHRCHFSWSLSLALGLGEHFMSTSMVTLTGEISITRPASRARRWRWVGGTVLIAFWSFEINLTEIKNYQYQNVYHWFKIKTLTSPSKRTGFLFGLYTSSVLVHHVHGP